MSWIKNIQKAFWERLLSCTFGTSLCLGLQITWFGEREGASATFFAVNNALVSYLAGRLVKWAIRSLEGKYF